MSENLQPGLQARPGMRVAVRPWPLVAATIFLVSAAGLSFEIALTRLFSLLFQYHFAFLAVSLAVFGLSLGAALAALVRVRPGTEIQVLALLLQGLAISYVLAAALIALLPNTSTVYLHTAAALLPFIMSGLIIAVAFRENAGASGALYAADLTGAATGIVAVLLLLTIGSPINLVLLFAAVIALASLLIALLDTGARRRRALASGGAVVLIGAVALLAANLMSGPLDYRPERIAEAPRDKTMLAILRDTGQDARILATEWSPFARVDVVESNDPDALYIFTDAGAGSYMYRFTENTAKSGALRRSAEYLPFTLAPLDEPVLILGAGGGRDILLALEAGAEAVTALEVNPAVVRATRRFAAENANILDRPEVELVVGDARNYIERAGAAYGLIYLNLVYTQAVEPASQALVENYIFTAEAFEAYFQRLAPGGQLAVISHNALEGSRAAVTALQALENLGIPASESLDHLLIWMVPHEDPTQRTTVLLLSQSALEKEMIDRYSAEAQSRSMQPIYIPGDLEFFFAPLRRGGPVADFVDADADFDLSPTHDDSPYFFHLNFGLPPAIRSTLIWALSLVAVVVVIALLSAAGSRSRGVPWIASMVYAAAIGAGFMLIEIPLIQRFQLLFGYPLLSLAMVLGTLLLASGLGSLISQRWPAASLRRRIAGAALFIAALVVAYWFLLPPLFELLLQAPAVARVMAVVVLSALLGLPLGIPFPSLLRLARERFAGRLPLLWALNGAFSVLGSTLAVVISMRWGFSWALLAGGALYLLLFALALGPMRTVLRAGA